MKQFTLSPSHNLEFLCAPWSREENIMLFKIGTCHGQWQDFGDAYAIISVLNDVPGNGHLEDVFEWFEQSCRRDKKAFMIVAFVNDRFYRHCIDKRGFKSVGRDSLIKEFK